MGKREPECRYQERIKQQQRALEGFVKKEKERAEDLLLGYRLKKQDIPDDQYRAILLFTNREYIRKPGALTLLYSVYRNCQTELPAFTKENAFDLLAFRFRMYTASLEQGGFL